MVDATKDSTWIEGECSRGGLLEVLRVRRILSGLSKDQCLAIRVPGAHLYPLVKVILNSNTTPKDPSLTSRDPVTLVAGSTHFEPPALLTQDFKTGEKPKDLVPSLFYSYFL